MMGLLKFLKLLVLVAVILGGAVYVSPGLQGLIRPFAPVALQSWLGGAAPTAGSKGTDRSQTAATGSSDKRAGGGAIAVSVVAARAGTLPVIERTYGMLQSPAVVQIGSRSTSQVTEVNVKDGQSVKTGDLLLTLDDRAPLAQFAKDKAALAKDQALLASATADLERAKTLVQKQAGTQQAYDQALAAQRAADANVASDQAAIDADQLQLGFTRITAPIDGRLGAIPVAVGDLVTSGGQNVTTLMTLTQMQPLKVSFRLPEPVLAPLHAEIAEGAKIRVQVIRTNETKPAAAGTLDFIDSAVDPSSGTIALGATLANEDLALWPGQHMNVEVVRTPLSSPALVPTVAIQPGQNGSFVWLLKDDQTVEPRDVTVERSENGMTAVASGLATGDKVVVEGQLRLTAGAKVKASEQPEKLAAEAPRAGTATP